MILRSCILFLTLLIVNGLELHLTTSDEGYMTVIHGFAAQLECTLSTCVRHSATVTWYKDNVPMFNSTKFLDSSGIDPKAVFLQHRIEIDKDKECKGPCSDSEFCEDGYHCIDNKCCPCASEEFTLVLRNLTFDDAGRYRCQIYNQSQQLEFQLEVLESGLKGGFHENISYDYSECCAEKGISPLCQAMCKPRDMHIHHFDPTSCKTDDYKNFLSCATEGGNRSHVHCCRTQLVPSFCYDFCSGNFQMLRKSHRLCLYYLPEIFECYNRAYLPYPDPPEDLVVNAIGSDELRVCWHPPPKQTSNKHLEIEYYSVYYKQIPAFPFLGGEEGLPLLTTDYEESVPSEVNDDEAVRTMSSKADFVPERKKRDAWVVVTHDSFSNDSVVREFKFDVVNTTETCVTLRDLRAATRYIVYVTATNSFGTSVPSSRALASTNAIVTPSNASLPQIEQCCATNGVSEYCASKLCNVRSVPNALETIAISTSCQAEWAKVSPCLADGRNHTDCCVRKGVQHDCLKICAGLPEPLPLKSLLCLNLDLAAIYQCLRIGYESHPSPPENVTVTRISENSVEVEWEEPAANAQNVQSYSLFIKKDEHSAPVREVHNVSSPHTEYGLDPDTEYTVFVQSHGATGDSLMSTAQVFFTRSLDTTTCPHGQPLYHPNGHRYYCGLGIRDCPPAYQCVVVGQTETDTYCCPRPSEQGSFRNCCIERGVSEECSALCTFNTSLTVECAESSDVWVQCASDGHDHSKCCFEAGIPETCMSACRHPFTLSKECIEHAPALLKCFATLHSNFPPMITNLEVVSRNATSVLLSWDVAEGKVEQYQVQLFMSNSILKQLNTTTNSMRFDELVPGKNFTARVTSFNQYGSSPPSLNISFETLQEDGSINKPGPPTQLRAAWNHGSRVNVTWEWNATRVNGEPISEDPVYSLYYAPSHSSGTWTSIKTKDRWYVMENLTLDTLYEVNVFANVENENSASSSHISIFAAPDDAALPEPKITIEPGYTNLTYNQNQQISVKCAVDSQKPLNVILTIANKSVTNSAPQLFAETKVTVNEKTNLFTCTVQDAEGRQNRINLHVFVQFGPEVTVVADRVNAYDDLSAELRCIIKAFPEPHVRWTYRKNANSVAKPISDAIVSTVLATNKYEYTLKIRNVTNRDGIYSCVATAEHMDTDVSKDIILNVASPALPLTPRFTLQCCADANIPDKCMKVCSVDPETKEDCSEFASELLGCATDGRDHRDCCFRERIPPQCLDMCNGDKSPLEKSKHICAMFAAKAVACMIRGHQKAPSPPGPVYYENLSKNSVKVHWTDPDSDSYKIYAVYYRPENSEDNYTVVKTKENEVVINGLDPDTNYNLALVSANALGHSPFVEAKILNNADGSSSGSKIGAALSAIFVLLLAIAVVGGVIYSTRTDAMSRFMRKFHKNEPLSDRDPTVAFENPGYGNEVQIRGLGHSEQSTFDSEWQNAELETAGNVPNENNSMRYAKLTS